MDPAGHGGPQVNADAPQLLEIAAAVAHQAADVLKAHRRRMDEGADMGVASKSSVTDPVSIADADSEQVLVEAITAARPDDGLLGEEGARRRGSTGLRWVIDPLDGTVNYLYGHPGWSVSVAVETEDENGTWQGLVGVVLDGSRDELFSAIAGGTARLDDHALTVNDPVELPMALVATGFGYERSRRLQQAALAVEVLGACRDIRRVGSAALDLCAVAAGRVDAYYEDTTQRWDWAAGAVIARAAGAEVTRLQTHADTDGVIAAGPHLHPQLAALIGRHAG